MRRVVVTLALLVLTMSVAASADIIANNKFGSVFFTSSGITSTSIQIQSFGSMSVSSGALGALKFSTGACLTGCNGSGIPLATGVGSTSTFSSGGSIFDIICKRKACGGFNAPLFTGSFTGTITLTEIAQKGQSLLFQLTGTISGILANGMTVSGTTTQTFFTATSQLNSGIAHLGGGTTQLVVPEPGTLGLLGTGLVGIAGMLRRKVIKA